MLRLLIFITHNGYSSGVKIPRQNFSFIFSLLYVCRVLFSDFYVFLLHHASPTFKRLELDRALKDVPNVLVGMLSVYTTFSTIEEQLEMSQRVSMSHVKTDPGL